jgi:ferrous iron transport protein A
MPAANGRTLDRIAPGESARVATVARSGSLTQRLLEMGLVPGARVRMIRAAPLGDPLEIEIDGYLLSLRRAEARLVELQPS